MPAIILIHMWYVNVRRVIAAVDDPDRSDMMLRIGNAIADKLKTIAKLILFPSFPADRIMEKISFLQSARGLPLCFPTSWLFPPIGIRFHEVPGLDGSALKADWHKNAWMEIQSQPAYPCVLMAMLIPVSMQPGCLDMA